MRDFGRSQPSFVSGGILSLEHIQHVSSPQYSIEEEVMDAAVAQDAAADVAVLNDSITDAAETAVAMDDLEVIVGDAEELTDREANLVAVAGDLAYAGSTPDVEPIVEAASMESYKGKHGKLTLENRIVDSIKRIWQYIKQQLEKAWKKVKEFFSKYFGPVKRMQEAFESLKKTVTNMSNKVRDNERTFELTSGVSILSIGGKALANAGDILSHGKTYGKFLADELSSDAADKARTFLEKVGKELADFEPEDPAKAGKSVNLVANAFMEIVKRNLKDKRNVTGSNSGDYQYWASAKMFGDHIKLIRVHKQVETGQKKGDYSDAKNLELLNRTSFSYREEVQATGHTDKPTECQFVIPNASQLEDMCEQGIEWTRLMQQYAQGRAVSDMEKERSRMQKATDSLEARFVKYENRSTRDSSSAGINVALYRQYVALNASALGLTAVPVVAIQRHAMLVMGAYRHIIRSSINRYE